MAKKVTFADKIEQKTFISDQKKEPKNYSLEFRAQVEKSYFEKALEQDIDLRNDKNKLSPFKFSKHQLDDKCNHNKVERAIASKITGITRWI